MAREIVKCENPKCKRRGVTELHQLNPDIVNLRNYCITNKRTLNVDEKKHAKLVADASKWRCDKCFDAFIKRHAYTEFYHLLCNKGVGNANKNKSS